MNMWMELSCECNFGCVFHGFASGNEKAAVPQDKVKTIFRVKCRSYAELSLTFKS